MSVRRVVGIDPGNVSAGVSFWEDGTLVGHGTVCPWHKGGLDDIIFSIPTLWCVRTENIRVCAEVPQNGTHDSRGGVQRALGMLLGQLGTALPFRRRDLVRVRPREWREGELGDAKATKAECVARAARYGGPYASEDEAEAVCIGAHGCRTLGMEPVAEGKWGVR